MKTDFTQLEPGTEKREPDIRDFGCLLCETKETMPFKLGKILVPVDFSFCSKALLRYAIGFARQFNASLVFLNVLPVHYSPGWEFEALNYEPLIEGDLQKDVETKLNKMIKEAVPTVIPASIMVRHGAPSIEIMSAAEECKADLIIMATHGHTGRVHAFIGSVAGDVTRLASCPVLVVRGALPEPAISDPNPFKANQKLPEVESIV